MKIFIAKHRESVTGGMFYPARSALCGIAGGLSYRL